MINLSTASLGKEMQVSQQTVSRWLSQLATERYVERRFNRIRLTPKAREFLEGVSGDLQAVLQEKHEFKLQGRVVAGLQEGQYYLMQPEYQAQLHKLLGYNVFPGTLNLQLSEASGGEAERKGVEGRKQLAGIPGIELKPFKKEGREFGGAMLYPCHIVKLAKQTMTEGAIIVPYKTHHGPNILELVAPYSLRDKLMLKNGDEVEVRVLGK